MGYTYLQELCYYGDTEKAVMRRLLNIQKEEKYLRKILDYIHSNEDIRYDEISEKFGDNY